MSKRKKRAAQRLAASPAPAQDTAPRRGVSLSAAAGIGPVERLPVEPFRPAKPLPGVAPAGTMADMAMDLGGVGGEYAYAAAGMYGEGLTWLGYPYLAQLAQRPEYRRISETIAKEMTREWITLTHNGDDDESEKLALISAEMDRLKVRDAFRRAAELDGFFGRGQIYLDTGSTGMDQELATPLVVDRRKIKPGALKAIRVVEPAWTYPAGYNSTDPLAADFYKPTAWFVMGKRIHATRLLTFVGREMPDMLKPAYSFGGLSLSQIAKPYVDNWLRTRDSVSDLIHSFSVSGIKTDMGTILEGGGPTGILSRVELFNRTRDNRGTMVLDKTEDFFNITTPLTTLDKLQAQAQEQIASIACIPLVKYLGITPSGLNASSDGEIRVFYDFINAEQQHLFSQPLRTLLDVIQLSLFGEIDPDIGFRFEPLWQMSEVEKAAIRKTNAEAAAIMIGDGVISPEEERERLAGEDGTIYPALDLSVEIEPPSDPSLEPDPALGQEQDPPRAAAEVNAGAGL